MDLATWLKQQGRGAKGRLARAADVRWQTIHEIARGVTPRPETAKAIEVATGGAVTAAELLGLTSAPAAAEQQGGDVDRSTGTDG